MALSKIPPSGQTQYAGVRNLVINGAMTVDQRNATVTSGDYSCDRWYVAKSNTDQLVFAADQDTESPDGFSNSLKVDVTTAETAIASDELFYIRYQIEGQDLQHLEYGASSAKSVTLSFWVRSSLTGKYSVLFYAIDSTRSNLQSITINTADTWEYKTITIDGDTGATIDNDNNAGYQFYITLAAGDNYHGTPHTGWGAYVATDDFAFSDQVDFSAQTGTFYLTGVQLEVGDKATDFEHRSYGQELALCGRYYQKWADVNWILGVEGTRNTKLPFQFSTLMRANPTCAISGGTATNGALAGTGVTDPKKEMVNLHFWRGASGGLVNATFSGYTLTADAEL